MARSKGDIERPYAPDYVSAETLAYRLDLSRSTMDDYVKRRILPPAMTIGTVQRWRWSDVEAAIAASNGELANLHGIALSEGDPFSAGTQSVATSNA